jgi:hypothetical protein
VRTLSSADKPQPIDLNRLDIPAYWVHQPQPLSGEAGAHRLVWGFHYHDESGPLIPPGHYWLKMTVNGKAFAQPFEVVRDPRLHVTDADLRAQFDLAIAITDEIRIANEALAKGNGLMASRGDKLAAADRARLAAMTGGAPARSGRRRRAAPAGPGAGSLSRNAALLAGILGALESAPAAPNPTFVSHFRAIRAEISGDVAFFKKIGG